MIKKTTFLILPVLVVSYWVLTADTATDQAVDQTFKADSAFVKTSNTNYSDQKVKSQRKLQIEKYKKKFNKQAFSKKFAALADQNSQVEPHEPSLAKGETKIAAKTKTKEEKAKEDEKQKAAECKEENEEDCEKKKTEDQVATKDHDSKSDQADNRDRSRNQKLSTDSPNAMSFSSFTTAPQAEIAQEENEADLAEDSEEDTASTTPGRPRPDVGSLSIFSPEYFKKLLTDNKLVEYEQALNADLNPEQKAAAYKEALVFLFSFERDSESFYSYDSFIKTQFLRTHNFAGSIAQSFSQEDLSLAQIDYSADLLNQLVLSWSSEHGSDDLFSEIYENTVLGSIPASLMNNEAILTLQRSIEIVGLDISNAPAVEVSVI